MRLREIVKSIKFAYLFLHNLYVFFIVYTKQLLDLYFHIFNYLCKIIYLITTFILLSKHWLINLFNNINHNLYNHIVEMIE